MGGAFEQGLRPVGVGSRLIADDLEAGYPLLEGMVIQIGHTGLDGVVKPLEARF